MPRLFTAIEIPYSVMSSLMLAKGKFAGARWIDPQNYHITLGFIGDIDYRTANEIANRLATIEVPGFEISLYGLGVFGAKNPKSIYAKVRQNHALTNLHSVLERQLRRIGLDGDNRKFVPHVAIARLRGARDRDVARYLSDHGGFLSPSFTVERFVLMSSKDMVGGGPYVVEECYDLAA